MIKYEDLSHEDKMKLYKEMVDQLSIKIPKNITLLEWYVGVALNGLISKYAHPYRDSKRMLINPSGCAAACIDFAEYLIKALEKKEEQARNPEKKDNG